MDCPHCRAALPEGAAACPACGVDLMKLKARELLAKLKKDAAPPATGEPPWLRSALYLGALAVGVCLLLYGAALLAGRRGAGSAAVAAPAPAPPPSEEPAAPAPSAPAPQGAQPAAPAPSAPGPASQPVVLWDGSPNSKPAPPPPLPPR